MKILRWFYLEGTLEHFESYELAYNGFLSSVEGTMTDMWRRI